MSNTDMVMLELPVPITVNHYYLKNKPGYTKAGKRKKDRRLSDEAWAFRDATRAAYLEKYGLKKPLDCRLDVVVKCHFPDRRKRDLDNFCGKGLMDALRYAGVYVDDGLIDQQLNIRGETRRKPGCVVIVQRHMTPNEREAAKAQ